jgi:predicted  nucleic acid-binding Zn-ribbon protein
VVTVAFAASAAVPASMTPVLASLIALQRLDTAAEAARRRLLELPAALDRLTTAAAGASEAVAAVKARLAENNTVRREFEKQVAVVDSRLARFEDHKAAVKTNQEYTALLHEIATAKAEKDAGEEQILLSMERADELAAELGAAEAAQAETAREGTAVRAELEAERRSLSAEIDRLAAEKARLSSTIEPAVLARYEQLLKQRRMVAVAQMTGEICSACHVRLRPAVAQQVRRNAEIVPCDSCQRILYFEPPAEPAAASP